MASTQQSIEEFLAHSKLREDLTPSTDNETTRSALATIKAVTNIPYHSPCLENGSLPFESIWVACNESQQSVEHD